MSVLVWQISPYTGERYAEIDDRRYSLAVHTDGKGKRRGWMLRVKAGDRPTRDLRWARTVRMAQRHAEEYEAIFAPKPGQQSKKTIEVYRTVLKQMGRLP